MLKASYGHPSVRGSKRYQLGALEAGQRFVDEPDVLLTNLLIVFRPRRKQRLLLMLGSAGVRPDLVSGPRLLR